MPRLTSSRRATRRSLWVLGALVLALGASACGDRRGAAADSVAASEARVVVVYNAGSLARPIRAALDSFARREGAEVSQENAGSLETARKLIELRKVPDVIALADYEVFPQLLMPEHVTWFARFARNRMVLAYTDRSAGAGEITTDNWHRVLLRPPPLPGVEVGRSDPNLDPAGYRTLMVFQLAERFYREPGIASRLLASAPPRQVRAKSAELVALLQARELDYAWLYESSAVAAGLRFVRLPAAIDLGSPADSAGYAAATVRVPGASRGDTLTLHGEPIVYALSIPSAAPHPSAARRFVAFLLSDEGKRVLRAEHLDVLDSATFVGTAVPPELLGTQSRPPGS